MAGQWFFVNPDHTKRRRATMAKAARDPKSGRYRKRRSSRRSSARNPRGGKMATNPKRKRRTGGGKSRKSYRRRRNPPKLNIVRTLQRGVQDGVAVVIGKSLVRIIPAQVKLPTTGAQGLAVQGLTAVGIALLAERFGLGKDFARFAAAGGFAAPIESFIKQANIPVISAGLADYPSLMAYPQPARLMPGVASYPEVEYESGMGAYAEPNGTGRYVEVYP